MKTIYKTLIVALVSPIFVPQLASAQASQIGISASNSGVQRERDIGNGDADSLVSYFHQGRSYECALIQEDFSDDQLSATPDDFRIFSSTVTEPDAATTTATGNGDVFPQMAIVKPLNPALVISAAQHALVRVSLVAAKTGLHKFTTVDAIAAGTDSDAYTVSCRETTLYGSYNRFYAGTAIIELENKAGTDIPVEITIINSAGTVIVDKQSETANANTRTDLIFSNLPSADLGQILITHTAPFGALSGTVAEYDYGSEGSITLKRERPLRAAQRS